MEDVLSLYQRAYDPRYPLVCMDETSKQLVGETRPAQAAKPGQPARQDYEYVRNGVCNLFLCCEPRVGWRDVKVTARRTRRDWAEMIKEVLDQRYPDAERVVLVLDNLNTHTLGSLYEAFPPGEARRLAERLELHYTPNHGPPQAELNIAEIELSVLSRQCLDRRIADQATLEREVEAWQQARNALPSKVDWQFTSDDARIKLKRLYPSIQG